MAINNSFVNISGIALVAGVFVVPYLIFLIGSLPMIHTSGLPSPLSFHFSPAPLAGIVKHSSFLSVVAHSNDTHKSQ
jgi:hypothetical protein